MNEERNEQGYPLKTMNSKSGFKETAVLCVLRSQDALLLLRRTKEPNLDKYTPIGGHVDPFETPRNAANREIREEAGLSVDELKFCGVLVETSPVQFNWVNFIYSAEVDRFDPPACQEGVLEWVEISRIPHIPTPTTDMYIYQLVAQSRTFMLNAEYDQALNLVLLQDEITGKVFYQQGADRKGEPQ